MPCVTFRNKLVSYSEELLAPRQTPKLEDYFSSVVRYCFSVYSQLPSISRGRPSFPARGRSKPLAQGPTHIKVLIFENGK